jgi:uncharacterized protein involved in response to NO
MTMHPAPPRVVPLWRSEPFRVFFPLGVVLGWIGIGHWLAYTSGLSSTYSCLMHGLVQTQAFLVAFALGFLFTALPRRTSSAPPNAATLAAAGLLVVATAAALVTQRWVLAQLGYLSTLLVLVAFAAGRLAGAGAGRRPPATFMLIPIGLLHGVVGAVLLILGLSGSTGPTTTTLGALLVQQGVFISLTIGVGGLILPLLSGTPPPADLGSSPRETRRAIAFAAAGATVFATFLLEVTVLPRTAALLRAVVVAVVLGFGHGAWRPPAKPGFHRRLAWLAVWMVPLGLAGSALWPDYRVPALHVLFVGGFGVLTFAVATHVVLGHTGAPELAMGRPPAVVATGIALLLAMTARVAADWSDTYFAHLGWAAGLWIAGTLVWLLFVAPRLVRRSAG